MSSKNNISENLFEKVRLATSHDIEDISVICSNQLIKNRKGQDQKTLEESGFLLGEYSKEKWQETISDNENCLTLVLEKREGVVGYLTGCDIIKTESELQEKVSLLLGLEDLERQVFYYSQIAKKQTISNVGKPLVLAMIDEIAKRKFSFVICKIIHGPIKNYASIAFHEKLGFKYIGEMYQEGYLRGIYLKKLF